LASSCADLRTDPPTFPFVDSLVRAGVLSAGTRICSPAPRALRTACSSFL